MANKIEVNPKKAVQVFLQGILQDIFNRPAKEILDELKTIVQKYNLTSLKLLDFPSKTTINLPSTNDEPHNENTVFVSGSKGF